ncbi:MAG: 2,3-diaminopropionate biosynthesis protein SbnA [Polyangiaceae bacterium]|nr:2,3-diaminopropionate biosynthesis protein SbnA [Polyangiaceae bacterium]
MTSGHRRPLTDVVAAIERSFRPVPVVELDLPGVRLFAQLAFANPVSSIKDAPAFWILKRAIERGSVDESTTLIESSSGNFAYALSVYARQLGLRFVPVIDPNISPLNEALLRATCGRTVKITRRDPTGGFLLTRLDAVRQLQAELDNAFWTNQYGNIDNLEGHYAITARSLCEALPRLDYAFIGVSSAGTLAGVSRRLKERFPGVRIIAVDVVGSIIFGGPPRKRYIPGIGASIQPDLLREARVDDVIVVGELESALACYELSRRHGLFLGGSSGSVYAAIQRHLPTMTAAAEPYVAFLGCDRGNAYLDTIYDPAWVDWLAQQEAEAAPDELGPSPPVNALNRGHGVSGVRP